MRRLALLALLVTTACAEEPPLVLAPTTKPAPTEADVLAATLPGVVLLVNHLPDGSIGYGAGILLDGEGRVLTNMHVVANAVSLGGLLHDPSRTSYIPQDGGLKRYLFENEKAIRPAILQRGEPVLDLAIVKLDADTRKLPRLAFRSETVRVGERVMAVGHPSETVWSFSAGLVSATHSGVIQTDASINHGNSGGPLIDARGRVVGVNTSRLFGDTQGIAFARPIAFAKELVEGSTGTLAMDLSTPERAFTSCLRAWELASASVGECFDEASTIQSMKTLRAQLIVKASLTPEQAAGMGAAFDRMDEKTLVAYTRQSLIDDARGMTKRAQVEKMMESGPVARAVGTRPEDLERARADGALDRALREGEPYVASFDQRRFERTGVKTDRKNPNALRDLRKMGIRVDRVERVGDRAWIVVKGKNLDATGYAYSELWWRRGAQWLPAFLPDGEDVKTLPASFPPPSTGLDELVDEMMRMITGQMEKAKAARDEAGEAKKPAPAKKPPKKRR